MTLHLHCTPKPLNVNGKPPQICRAAKLKNPKELYAKVYQIIRKDLQALKECINL